MEKIFADGLIWQDPHEKAPDFIKGSLVINAERFNDFLKNNMQYASAKGWLKVTMKESKGKTIYFELDTYKPAPKETPQTTTTSVQPDGSDPIDVNNIPF